MIRRAALAFVAAALLACGAMAQGVFPPAPSGGGGGPGVVKIATLSLPVTAVAETDFTMSLPTGAVLLSANTYLTTPYGAGTDTTIAIGSAPGLGDYMGAATIQCPPTPPAGAAISPYPTFPFPGNAVGSLSLPAAPNLFVTVLQTGTPSAAGAATLVVEYAVP